MDFSSGGTEDGHLKIAGHHFPVDEKVVITHWLCSPCRTDLVSGFVIFLCISRFPPGDYPVRARQNGPEPGLDGIGQSNIFYNI